MTKPSLPQGTRDFGPETVRKRSFILNTIRGVFEVYGFQPLETPAMENLETLMGKYGEEGDKLIFKILNNGLNDPKNSDKAKIAFENVLQGKNDKNLTERALRYDLTIPFARYVAMNHGQLTFPFRRYQIQPVWRADRPQRGRYREFYQCDADTVGSHSLLNEIELVIIYSEVFGRLGIPVDIKINNRKILTGIAELIGEPDKMTQIATAIDKADKIGIDGVKQELRDQQFTEEKIDKLRDLIFLEAGRIAFNGEAQKESPNLTILNFLQNGSDYRQSVILQEGVAELKEIIEACDSANIPNLKIELSLARGLNYYTGTIFEVEAGGVKMGSIGGGGRYDDLTSLFGVPNIPGVGISFGVDRIYDVMEELKLFPEEIHTGTRILFFNLGKDECKMAFSLMQQLRQKAIPCELYHEQAKFDKQFKYAEKKQIRYAVIIGSEELKNGTCKLKDLTTGTQTTSSFNELLAFSF